LILGNVVRKVSTPVNIDSRGYGKIYKAIMRTPHLPILAKAIYAYFCAYAGNGHQAYPKRDKIVRDLKMNKNTYTKHLNALVAAGYIAKERTAAGNIYTIMRTVPGYEKPAQAEDDMTDILVMESVGAQGFGTVPKLVMFDARLTAQAKAIYAYFAYFAGAGTTAFPRHHTILRDLNLSHTTYYAHYNLLLHYGYLTVEQRKSNGKYAVSLYRLPDFVEPPDTFPSSSCKTSEKAMYEKLSSGENGVPISNSLADKDTAAPMSQKLAHGALLKTPAPLSQILSYEKLASEKMDSENLGQPYIKNSSTSNSSLEKEQEYYHQGVAPDDNIPVPLLSLEQAKEMMRYEYWRSEALAWGELQDMLGHFPIHKDRARYIRKLTEILDEIARQARKLPCDSQSSEQTATIFESEAFAIFFDNVLTHWDEIRSAKGYVGASLHNLQKNTSSME
jgi:hypothetical protein